MLAKLWKEAARAGAEQLYNNDDIRMFKDHGRKVDMLARFKRLGSPERFKADYLEFYNNFVAMGSTSAPQEMTDLYPAETALSPLPAHAADWTLVEPVQR
jgi:hypothetical protein